jgi:hypothetical protein
VDELTGKGGARGPMAGEARGVYPAVPMLTPTLAAKYLSLTVIVALAVAGCSAAPGARNLPSDALHDAIAHAVGDPSTCVLLADRATRKVVYRYGETFNCVRGLPACDRPGTLSATGALALADGASGRAASCPSNADGSRLVGWAEGRANSRSRDLIYSAMMEGDRAMPGHEIAARLDDAFDKAGL